MVLLPRTSFRKKKYRRISPHHTSIQAVQLKLLVKRIENIFISVKQHVFAHGKGVRLGSCIVLLGGSLLYAYL